MSKYRWDHVKTWLDERLAGLEAQIARELAAVEVDNALGTFRRLLTDAKSLAAPLDGDQLQDIFDHDMDSDGFFNILVKDYYPDGQCPDCDEDIPQFATAGESCDNCGHVFNELYCEVCQKSELEVGPLSANVEHAAICDNCIQD
jgi:hypothetical protein